MGRIVNQPVDLKFNYLKPISSARTIGAGGSESVTGFIQTFSSVYGSWRFEVGLPISQKTLSRSIRGWLTALHGGANATILTIPDADRGVFTQNYEQDLIRWGNGEAWGNGRPWQGAQQITKTDNFSAKGTDVIYLEATLKKPDVGSRISFLNHYGIYELTENITGNTWRVWPTLRADIPNDTYYRFDFHYLACRLENEETGLIGRNTETADETTLTFVEIPHDTFTKYFEY